MSRVRKLLLQKECIRKSRMLLKHVFMRDRMKITRRQLRKLILKEYSRYEVADEIGASSSKDGVVCDDPTNLGYQFVADYFKRNYGIPDEMYCDARRTEDFIPMAEFILDEKGGMFRPGTVQDAVIDKLLLKNLPRPVAVKALEVYLKSVIMGSSFSKDLLGPKDAF